MRAFDPCVFCSRRRRSLRDCNWTVRPSPVAARLAPVRAKHAWARRPDSCTFGGHACTCLGCRCRQGGHFWRSFVALSLFRRRRRKSKPPDPKTFRKMNPPPQNVPKIRMDGCTQGNCCTTSQRCHLLYQDVTLDDLSLFHSKMIGPY